jgi:hypothetical protein
MHNGNDFIGKSKKAAQDLAEKKNMIFHLVRIDQEAFFDYPSEVRDDRVCIEIEQGKVVRASIQ